MKTLQRTLTIVKPDAVRRNAIGDIIEQFEKNGFHILAMKMLEISKHQAEQFYAAYGEGYNYRNESYGDVVIQLADRFHKSPAIGAKHQYGICRVDQRHTSSEESREDKDRPERQTL